MRNFRNQTYGPVGKIGTQFLDDGDDWVVHVRNREYDFIFWIIKAAEAREVFVGLMVDTAHGLYDAGGRQELRCSPLPFSNSAEVTNDAVEG